MPSEIVSKVTPLFSLVMSLLTLIASLVPVLKDLQSQRCCDLTEHLWRRFLSGDLQAIWGLLHIKLAQIIFREPEI